MKELLLLNFVIVIYDVMLSDGKVRAIKEVRAFKNFREA